ncbi:MAG: DNA mismatch repair protein MutS [Chloroflexi bacterium]|nr:DNA mismatch repair protein MutS [Chloroflexota bacterium]
MRRKRDEHGHTPLRGQYLQLKRKYPHAILLFRLGDFYETFDDDAVVVAAALNITLTSKEMGKGERVPLAGIPYHALNSYLARLIRKGYHVAICEQLTDPAESKGLVERDVVRVVTPGTVLEPSLLNVRANNYLAAFVATVSGAGLAYADATTGEFAATQLSGTDWRSQLAAELGRLRPAECLLPDESADPRRLETSAEKPGDVELDAMLSNYLVTRRDPWRFGLHTTTERLKEHFGTTTLDGFGLAGVPLATRAAGGLVQYLAETHLASLAQLGALRLYSTDGFMTLDLATRRNLELTHSGRGSADGTLLGVLDRTVTAMGARLLRRWINQPLLDRRRLEARLDAVAALVGDAIARTELLAALKKLADLERLGSRASQRIATPRDVGAIRRTLELLPGLKRLLEETGSPPLTLLAERLDPCDDLADLLGRALVPDPPATLNDGGVFNAGFATELDELVASSAEARQWVAGLERSERERTGIRSLRVGYNKVFGYYLEITNSNRSLVPADYIRKQTLVGAERYITPELKEKEALILSAQEKQVEIETRLFRELCERIAEERDRIGGTTEALAHLDVFTALAEVAVHNGYVRPELNDGSDLEIAAGRHPVVELSLQGGSFVPNDVRLATDDCQIILLTGPNMAGKSTVLRQTALIVLLAQIGSFVPASRARIGLVDRIFTRVGAQDDLAGGQSTFMVEMTEAAQILTASTPRSLAILDEVGRGTSTYDGVAIARAIVEYLHDHPEHRPKTLFATHYHELAALAETLPRVRNFRVDVLEDNREVTFLYRVVPGAADRSYGVHVARLAGIPRPVVKRATEILAELERRSQLVHGADPLQIPLFGAATPAVAPAEANGYHEVIGRLLAIDPDELSPREALTALYDLHLLARAYNA